VRRVIRLLILVLVAASLIAGGVALASSPPVPGKGCGDKNHQHDRYLECPK
jgi:hypothetical protein